MGALISVSGVDGSGKSTQIDRLARALRARGRSPRVFWHRPGYSAELDALRSLVRRVRPNSLPTAAAPERRAKAFANPRTQLVWFCAAVADMALQYGIKVRVWRLFGQDVICDRYLSDAQVDLRLRFPAVADRFGSAFSLLSLACPRPDLAVLLLVPDTVADARLSQKNEPFPDDLEVRAARRRSYESLGATGEFVVVDASEDIERVTARIVAAAEQAVDGRS
ncbi:MAG: hypothetical protein R3B13_22970 [Polyangiaceae bacterium]